MNNTSDDKPKNSASRDLVNLLIAIVVVILIGRTLDIIDPVSNQFQVIINWLSLLTAALFIAFIYKVLKQVRKDKKPKE